MVSPLVSVVIPTFNSSAFILEALESVFAQTYPAIEVLVVDDGSTDDTQEKLAEAVKDGRIRYVYQENRGLGAARNTGIRLAAGKFIQFLDADDLLAPDKIEKQVELLERAPSPSICGSDFRHFSGSDKSKLYGGDEFQGVLPFDNAALLFAFQTVIHRWLFPISILRQFGGFKESAPDVWVMEDWLLLWQLAANKTPVLYVNEPLVLYRRHAESMTTNFEKAANGHFIALEFLEQYQKQHNRRIYSRAELRRLRESYHYELALRLIESNSFAPGWLELLKATLRSQNRRQVKLLLLVAVPVFRSGAIEWSKAANDRVWSWRREVSQQRTRFYRWRQTRPLRRLAAAVALLSVWPALFVSRRFRTYVSGKRETQRILILHFGGLGDTLMLTPALTALKQRFPSAKIDLVTLHEHVKTAFQNHSRIDRITTLPAYSGPWIISRFAKRTGVRSIVATLRYYPELVLRFGLTRYDLGINFGLCDFDQRFGNAFLYCLGIAKRIGFAGVDEKLLTQSVPLSDGSQHRVDGYLELLKPVGIFAADKRYEYSFSNRDIDNTQLVLRERGVDELRPLAVIHPGGKLHVNSRRWPAKYFARVCDFLTREGFKVVLTGDKDDVAVCDEVARSTESTTVSIAGSLTFSETAALLSLAELVITNDTATLHLSEAAQTPQVLSVFGPTDPSVLAPQNDRHIVFRSNLPCAPCMGGTIDANTERCWRDVKEECLWQTSPEQVIAVLSEQYVSRAVRVASA